MLTAVRTQVRIYSRNPQLALLFVLPAMLVAIMTPALAAVLPEGNPYQVTVPAFALFFAFFGMTFAASAFFQERIWGNWPRLLSLATPRLAIVAGKTLAPVLVIVAQMSVLMVFGALVWHIQLGNPFALLLVIVLVAACSASLGMVLSTIARTQNDLNQLGNILVITLAAFGGSITPEHTLPSPVQAISPFTPHHWALEGFHNVMVGTDPLRDMLVPCLVLAAWILAAQGLGWWRFRFERMIEPA